MDHLSAAGSSATRNLTTTEPPKSLNQHKTVNFRFQRPHTTFGSFCFTNRCARWIPGVIVHPKPWSLAIFLNLAHYVYSSQVTLEPLRSRSASSSGNKSCDSDDSSGLNLLLSVSVPSSHTGSASEDSFALRRRHGLPSTRSCVDWPSGADEASISRLCPLLCVIDALIVDRTEPLHWQAYGSTKAPRIWG